MRVMTCRSVLWGSEYGQCVERVRPMCEKCVLSVVVSRLFNFLVDGVSGVQLSRTAVEVNV